MKKLLLAVAAVVVMAFGAIGVTKNDYEMKFTVTVADGVGDKTAENAVIPLRLSESAINGFRYSDFSEADGTDLYIVDGSNTRLDYEIDMWNPSGETTVWVKVPTIAAGTVLTVYYNGTKNTDNVPNNVWSLFLGVWHFNETSVSGTSANAYEATGKTALTGYDTPKTTSVNGLFGLARQPRDSNYQNFGVGGVFLPAMTLNGKFAISGWFNIANCGYPTFFSTKETFADSGFHYYIRSTWSMGNLELLGDERSDGWNSASTSGKVALKSWNRYCIVHDDETAGANFWLYVDGEKTGQGNKGHGTVTDNNKEICVGNVSCEAAKVDNGPGCSAENGETGAGRSLCGQMDEIRIQSYENFNADREYFEGAIAKDASLTVYSPAASCGSLAVGLTFEVIKRMAPAEINFTATVDGATGTCTYMWDFDNDGVIDRVGTSATETWTCTVPGKYNARVSMFDSTGVSGEITTLDYYIVNGVLYVDGDAETDGEGTQESPFNSLRTLSTRLNNGDEARLCGTFVAGDEAAPIAFEATDIVIDKWGDEKPLVKSTNVTFVASSGILVFNGANVAISNLVFNMTKESFLKSNIIRFNGNNAVLGRCDFSVAGGKCDYVSGYAGGVGTDANQSGLLIADCSFKGFRDGDKAVFPLMICEDATVARCLFEDVSCAIRANNGRGGTFNFISNIVLNAESESTAGATAGVVIKGGWNYFSGSTIAYNRFVNTNENQKAGCVILCTSKTGQNGINAHHNTVVGYKSFAVFDNGTQDPWTFTFFDNLVLGCEYFFKDEKVTATYATQKNGCIRNNYHAGVFRDVPDGYTFNSRMVVDGNVVLAKLPEFQNTTDVMDPGYYRPMVVKTDPLVAGGWTDSGAYPAYIGALKPQVQSSSSGLLIIVR